MSRIYLVCPSYGSVERVRRLLASAESTAADPSALTLCVGYDEDDPEPRIVPAPRRSSGAEIIRQCLPTSGIGAHAGTLAELYAVEPDDVVFVACDDEIFESTRWDQIVRERVAEERGPRLYYVDDGINGPGRATITFMTKRTSDLVGGFGPPWMNVHGDVWLWCLFNLFDPPRVSYVPEIRVRHDVLGANPRHETIRMDVYAAIRKYGPALATRQRDALVAAIRRAEGTVATSDTISKDGLTLTVDAAGNVAVSVKYWRPDGWHE